MKMRQYPGCNPAFVERRALERVAMPSDRWFGSETFTRGEWEEATEEEKV
jgi:hypothetical protein